jgi:hypothetical protein
MRETSSPVGALLIRIKDTHVRDHVLLVILSEGWSGWRYVSDMWIEWRRFHRRSRRECGVGITQPQPRLWVKFVSLSFLAGATSIYLGIHDFCRPR